MKVKYFSVILFLLVSSSVFSQKVKNPFNVRFIDKKTETKIVIDNIEGGDYLFHYSFNFFSNSMSIIYGDGKKFVVSPSLCQDCDPEDVENIGELAPHFFEVNSKRIFFIVPHSISIREICFEFKYEGVDYIWNYKCEPTVNDAK